MNWKAKIEGQRDEYEGNGGIALHQKESSPTEEYGRDNHKEMKKLNTVVSVKTLLGYYPKIFISKSKVKKYKNSIENVLTRVMEYVSKTNRFNRRITHSRKLLL